MSMSKFKKFIKKHYPKLLAVFLFLLLLGSYMKIFAIVAPYQAGSSTLNPACAPGEINCFVEIFPDQITHSGEFLTTDGVNVSWAPIVGAGGGTVTSVS